MSVAGIANDGVPGKPLRAAVLPTSAHDAVDGSSAGTSVPMWALLRLPLFRGASILDITTIGLDIAKSVFQIHGVNAAGEVVIRR
jgi:hypothetical protein